MSKRTTLVLLSPALLLSACGDLGHQPATPLQIAEGITEGMPVRPTPTPTPTKEARAPHVRQPDTGSPPPVAFDQKQAGTGQAQTPHTPTPETPPATDPMPAH